MIAPNMTDNAGRQVAKWLPHMQSTEFLRAAIGRCERTAECWSEIKKRNERVAAGMAVIAGLRGAA